MSARSHLSIGEVLSLLREEFPDITISKIRFLESQGLVDPERTPSGYRKFYDHDVDRLRWILRQQRENFLPLKVIRGRLSEHEPDGDEPSGAAGAPPPEPASTDPFRHRPDVAEWTAGPNGVTEPAAAAAHEPSGSDPVERTGTVASGRPTADPVRTHTADPVRTRTADIVSGADIGIAAHRAASHPDDGAAAHAAGPVPAGLGSLVPSPAGAATAAPAPPRPATPRPSAPQPTGPPAHVPAPARVARGMRSPGVPPTRTAPPPAAPPEADVVDDGDVESYTLEELAAAAGVAVAEVAGLRDYGLITAQPGVGGSTYFDVEALEVVHLAAMFARHGVEARHLRAWKTGADREVSLFEQVIVPLLRQRNPQARRQAHETLDELADAGGRLREVLVRQALRAIR